NNAASSRNPPKRVRRSRLTAVGILVVYGEEDVNNLKPLNVPGEAEIDCLFTHPKAQRRGIAAELYRKLLRYAVDSGVQCLRVEASFYAKAFFGKQGFTTLKRNQHQRHGEVLTNFSMQLPL
ncbi:MAG: hypothetical protein JG763_2840, partial [Shewanella sp.]|uniref:GNAT family N-acetyltransferase n=2 Tax=Shewanella sp. TaxID=50422 RepID=UPI001EC5C2CE